MIPAGAVALLILETFGIDLPPLAWSFVGALLMLAYSPDPVGRWRAMSQAIASGFMGALIGLGISHIISMQNRYGILLFCAVGGFAAYPLMQRLMAFIIRKVDAK